MMGSRMTSRAHVAQPAGTLPAEPVRTIDLSLMFFSADERAPSCLEFVMKAVEFADAAGLKAVWFPERHFDRFGGLFPNPALFCAAAATVTRRIRLRAGSVVLPLHDMLRVHEDWAVVDQFRRIWRGESASRKNGDGHTISVTPLPRPLQRDPHLWLTIAKQPALFQEAGRRGLNVLTALLMQPLEQLSENIKLYRDARAGAGHDPKEGRVTLMLHTYVGSDDQDAFATVSEPLRRYLASSISLWATESTALRELGERERAGMIEFAFQRYVRTSSLIGGPATITRRMTQIARLGVDEIACLIDFGPAGDAVMSSLRLLADGWATTAPGASNAED
jgi:alkanesulfonate monooxygenase SsuD/methylene tetrahydromethanopterin reductase-like flavin-dependent oxidoreductase (luciferase family)